MEKEGEYTATSVESVTVKSYFQPLYSVREKKFSGLEALSRGVWQGQDLNAKELFTLPTNNEERLLLNRKCIISALTAFSQIPDTEDLSVFINFDSSVIDSPDIISGNILQIVTKAGIDPSQIVIELIESEVNNFSRLLEFVDLYRSKGFLIALDDVGSGYSNFDRIVRIQPDILKIDRELVNGISGNFYQQSVCKALIDLSHNIGSLALAEGVETLEDALLFQEFGADMIQGFYFSKPESEFNWSKGSEEIERLISGWKHFVDLRDQSNKLFLSRVKKEAESVTGLLKEVDLSQWDSILFSHVNDYKYTQCLYILDVKGIQISQTALSSNSFHKKHLLFHPAKKGTDHSLKSFFVKRQHNQKWFFSDPYISYATGDICRTINLLFEYKGSSYYLCLDVPLKIKNFSELLKMDCQSDQISKRILMNL